jgi:hypothetical protein
MRLLPALLLVTCTLLSANAQEFKEGFVRLGKDNYVYGYVWSATDAQAHVLCMFKENLADSARVYYAADIDGYGFLSGGSFVKETIVQNQEKADVFLKVLVDGPVELSTYLQRFFISRADTVRAELVRTTYRSAIQRYVAACAYLRKNVVRVAFTQKSLTQYISQYGDCIEADPEVFHGSQERLKVVSSVSVGYNAASIGLATPSQGYTYLDELTLFNETPYFAAAGLTLYHTGLPTLRLAVSGAYSPARYHSVRSEPDYVAEVNLSYKELRVPVTVEFVPYKSDKLRPSLHAGYVFTAWSGLTTSTTLEQHTGTVVVIDELQPLADIKPPGYITAGASVSMPLGSLRGYFSADYYTGSSSFILDTITQQAATAKVSLVTLCLGISFR